MFDDIELPDTDFERVQALQNVVLARATGGASDEREYQALRRKLLNNPDIRNRLPPFVRTCRTLAQFWLHIKGVSDHYAPRRQHIWDAFVPALDYLEGKRRAPADAAISEVLATFDADGVHAVWEKALERRHADPEGAITSARTLLETVCKRILDDAGESYTDKEDLPHLYDKAAALMSLAPNQHTEIVFKAILGNCKSVVGNLASLRNKIGDAHGKGGKPVKPQPRHAALAVNLAGAMATFLVETWTARKETPQ